MNSEEAKNILELCRPDHAEDLDDPLINEAFGQLEQNSELCAWFEEQQIVDAKICEELKCIAPSQHLKAFIINGMQERMAKPNEHPESSSNKSETFAETTKSTQDSTSSSSKIVWLRPLIGIAAVFLLASVLMVLSHKEPSTQISNKSLPAEALASDSTTDIAGIPDIIQFLSQQLVDFNSSKFDKRSEQVNELQSYLTLYGKPSPSEIPQKLEAAPTIGCVTFDYGNTQMSMICFKNGKVYHLITVNKADLRKNSLPDKPHAEAGIYKHQKQAFKVWSAGDQLHILCVKGTEKDLPEFI